LALLVLPKKDADRFSLFLYFFDGWLGFGVLAHCCIPTAMPPFQRVQIGTQQHQFP
jgi:hypothetical protein